MADTVDDAIQRRRERKRRNTKVWRDKERHVLDTLRGQVEALERQLQTHVVPVSKVSHSVAAKLESLNRTRKTLESQNAKLLAALEMRDVSVALRSSALGDISPPLGSPLLYDNVFLINQIQQALRDMSGHVPSTIDEHEQSLDMRLINGFLAKSVLIDNRDLYFEFSKTVPSFDSDTSVTSSRHWTICTQAEPYLRLNYLATDFHVIYRPHNDLYVVRCSLQLHPHHPPVERYMVVYLLVTDRGYDYCSMNFAPDLSCIMGALKLKYRTSATDPTVATVTSTGRCVVPAPAFTTHHTVFALAAQLQAWERLLRGPPSDGTASSTV